MKSAKLLLAGIGLFIAGSVMADTFYLHENMALGTSPNDKTLWWTEPVGGVTQDSLGAPTTGNRFDLNKWGLRAPNTGSSTFPGTFVVETSGTALAELHTSTWSVTGMDINETLQMRLRQSTVTLNITDLALGSSGVLKFRTLTGNNNLNVSATASTGTGVLEFGDPSYANDVNGVWGLFMSSTSFSGTVSLVRGKLSIGNVCALSGATLAINVGEDNSVELSGNPNFGSVNYGATAVADGTYTAADLNTLLSTTRFSGAGSLIVGAAAVVDPDDFWLHANMAHDGTDGGDNVLIKSLWWDDPVGGSQMASGDTFANKRFNVNGYAVRTPNMGFEPWTATNSFNGTLVVDKPAGVCELITEDWRVHGFDISSYYLMRIRGSVIDLTVTNMLLGAGGDLKFRTNTNETNLNVSVETLSGAGNMTFGRYGSVDFAGIWSLSINGSADAFSGKIAADFGQLTLANAFAAINATFAVNAEEDKNSVVLAAAVNFGSMSYGAVTVPDGTYTAAELNSLLSTTCFSGSGTMLIGPVPPTVLYGLWTAAYPALGSSTNYLDDFEPDGMDNLLEYALGGDPTFSDAAGILPTSYTDGAGSWMYYIYNRRLDAGTRGLTYSVVSGTDLIYGVMTNATEEVGFSAVNAEFETVTNRMPLGAESQAFMKLEVEIAD